MMRILNLDAGLGGNIELIDDKAHDITNIELDPKIAAILARRKPRQKVIVTDAHKYLVENYKDFDFIWDSPPCQSHSKMNKFTRHNRVGYMDGQLIERIVFLDSYFKGNWVVENVVPYYKVLYTPTKIGRHLFWSNYPITPFDPPKQPKNFINEATISGKKIMQEWLGIHYEENIYYGKNHCPAQILRNCVHPIVGKKIFDQQPLTPRSGQ